MSSQPEWPTGNFAWVLKYLDELYEVYYDDSPDSDISVDAITDDLMVAYNQWLDYNVPSAGEDDDNS